MIDVLVYSDHEGGYSARLPIKDSEQLKKVKAALAPLGFILRTPNR